MICQYKYIVPCFNSAKHQFGRVEAKLVGMCEVRRFVGAGADAGRQANHVEEGEDVRGGRERAIVVTAIRRCL